MSDKKEAVEEEIKDLQSEIKRLEQRVVKSEAILVRLARKTMNSYCVDKMLSDSKDGMMRLGGAQNCYSIQHVRSVRDEAISYFGENIKNIELLDGK